MPFPSPETALNTRFFNAHTIPYTTSPTKFTRYDEAALQNFEFGLKRTIENKSVFDSIGSPTNSSVTLALEDDEIKRIFASDKPAFDVDRTPRPITHSGTPLPASQRPRSYSVDELNPHAKEFVPSQTLSEPASGPRSRQILRPVPGPGLGTRIPRWMRTFRRAVTTTEPAEQEPLAQVIVAGDVWESDAMAELAQAFAWRGAEDVPAENACVAALAQSIYQKFIIMKSEDTAETFLWHLKEAVVGTYMSVWDVVSVLCVIVTSCDSVVLTSLMFCRMRTRKRSRIIASIPANMSMLGFCSGGSLVTSLRRNSSLR